jgi:hypothetical protein
MESKIPTPSEIRATFEAVRHKIAGAECDVWDVWVEELKSVRQLLLEVWKAAEVVSI